jgi:hypothetical protein
MFRVIFFGTLLLVAPALATGQEQQLAPLPPALPRTHTPRPTTAAITAADLMTRLYIFADDSMQGRKAGSRGNAKGTVYLAAEARRIGLKPAGDNGTYFQNLPDTSYFPVVLDASLRIGKSPLALVRDFLPIGTHSLHARALAVVYGGRTDAPLTLTPAQTAGKLVVFTMPAPIAIQLGQVHSNPTADSFSVPQVVGAAAVGLVALDAMTQSQRDMIFDMNMELHQQPDRPVLLLGSAAAKRLFGKELDAIQAGAAGKIVSVAYTFISSMRNVVAILPGSDPVLRNEYVALGSHNDHVGFRKDLPNREHDSLRVYQHFVGGVYGCVIYGHCVTVTPGLMDTINAEIAKLRRVSPPRRDSIANGADDNGSGCVSMLEIAEQLAAMPVKPKRSIIFVWHENEEGPASGSALFVKHPTVPFNSIVVELDADMIGRGDASDILGGGPNYLEMADSRMASTELGDLIDRVNQEDHHNFLIDYATGANFAGHSDDGNYTAAGIPTAFFFTGVHPDIHAMTDEPEYIDYPKMARVASFISDVAVHVANLDHRLVIDHPLPPSGSHEPGH